MIRATSGPYTIHTPQPLTDDEVKRILCELESVSGKSEKMLGGRGTLAFVENVGGKEVAIKPYLRGGLMGRINKKRYFGGGPSRAALEYCLLKKLQNSDARVPTPVGFIETGSLLKCCWLMMETIPHQHTLATLPTHEAEERLSGIFDALAPQIKALIHMGIHHVDLHPGNIIVGEDDAPIIIDFDKAKENVTDAKALRASYIERWHRAVIKHKRCPHLSRHFKRIMEL